VARPGRCIPLDGGNLERNSGGRFCLDITGELECKCGGDFRDQNEDVVGLGLNNSAQSAFITTLFVKKRSKFQSEELV